MKIETDKVTFVDEHSVLEQLQVYFRNRRPTLLVGEPGVGKTTLVELLAQQHGARLIQKMGGEFSVAKLVGQHELQAENGATTTAFVKGPLVRAIETGAIFYFDELDNTSPDCQDLLHQVLDHRRSLSKADVGMKVAPGDDEFIYPHSDFWFVGTCVQKSRMPSDFVDRFRVVEVRRLSMEVQIDYLTKVYPLPAATIQRLVRIADLTIRLNWNKPASFRQISNATQDVLDGIDVDQAIHNCLINPNADSIQDITSLRQAMESEGLETETLLADLVVPKEQFEIPSFNMDSIDADQTEPGHSDSATSHDFQHDDFDEVLSTDFDELPSPDSDEMPSSDSDGERPNRGPAYSHNTESSA